MVFMDGVFETCEALVKAPDGRSGCRCCNFWIVLRVWRFLGGEITCVCGGTELAFNEFLFEE